MNGTRLLSFIVLSYNYEEYIGQTIGSILAQSVTDLEVVVVDDASADRSCEIIRSFADPRVRLLINEENRGGAASYNRAVLAATGRYLVNVDADDWIAPTKAARQLDAMARAPVDILGSYAHFVGADGTPHPDADTLEGLINQPRDLNQVHAWVGSNHLVRSTTMIDRAAHLRIGLDDPAMVRAPDYELWTRALAAGLRFGMVPEPLTYYRLQPRGVTFGDPAGTFFELAYAMHRNLVPLIEQQDLPGELAQIYDWMIDHPEFAKLEPSKRQHLIGALLCQTTFLDFADFRAKLLTEAFDSPVAAIGRRIAAVVGQESRSALATRRQAELAELAEARDFWHERSEAFAEARDFWHEQSTAFEARVEALQQERQTPRQEGQTADRFRRIFQRITHPFR